jgi:hypothetical protein
MLCAVRKREEARMVNSPRLELVAGGGDKALADTAIPQHGVDGNRPKKPDAAPARREIRAGERPFMFGGEGSGVLGTEPAMDEVAVGPEVFRIGCAEKRAKGELEDLARLRRSSRSRACQAFTAPEAQYSFGNEACAEGGALAASRSRSNALSSSAWAPSRWPRCAARNGTAPASRRPRFRPAPSCRSSRRGVAAIPGME